MVFACAILCFSSVFIGEHFQVPTSICPLGSCSKEFVSTFIAWSQHIGQENLVSLFGVDRGDKGRLSPSVSSLQVFAFMTSVLHKQFLIALWWERRTFKSHAFRQCSEECVILETKFRGEGKENQFLFKADLTQTEIHRTVVRLQTNSLFAFFMFRLLQIYNPSEHGWKKKEQTVVDFVSIFVGDCLLNNAHIDGEAADQQFVSKELVLVCN